MDWGLITLAVVTSAIVVAVIIYVTCISKRTRL